MLYVSFSLVGTTTLCSESGIKFVKFCDKVLSKGHKNAPPVILRLDVNQIVTTTLRRVEMFYLHQHGGQMGQFLL